MGPQIPSKRHMRFFFVSVKLDVLAKLLKKLANWWRGE